ncbi:hypothetical protein [Stackebrandtia soli]|uniref:hypothetical protein n=1 Tax=Stackebrandtia soli TaxID=1892856 RepID=UPI0039E87153
MHADDRVDEAVTPELASFLRTAVDDRPMVIAGSVCAACGGRAFALDFDEVEGVAARECHGCEARAFIADSAEFWEEADTGTAVCFTCDGEDFEVAVAFTMGDDGTVRWITIGLRCTRDDTVDVFADWKIDYAPTDHLLTMA